MAVADRQPDNTNFLSPVAFRFTCDILPQTEFYCQSANLPGVSIAAPEVSTPFGPNYVAGDRVEYEELNIRMIIDENLKNFSEIYEWITGLGISENFERYQERARKGLDAQGVLTILTGSNVPQVEIHFRKMFPISISGLQFDISNTDIVYLTADMSFRYNNYQVKNILNN
tara:strand:+ start:766 stop:1278 length:513 start_codon:yes stop_codon:yes gene_type:complete